MRMMESKTGGWASAAWQQTTRSFVTHDLRVNEAMLSRVGDPAMRVALGMRQLHSFVAAVQAWFTARDLHREGWKKDLTRLATADPKLFDLVEQWLAATDVATRHEIFTEVAARVLEPIGGPIPTGSVLCGPDDVWETLENR